MSPRPALATPAARATFAALLLCACGAAGALDIPMERTLADAALDSKTCFSELASGGKLLGFELGAKLLVASDGKLVTLPGISRAEVGDGRGRSYAAEGIRVHVAPRQTRRWVPDPDVEEIREKAAVTITERGKRRTLRVDVRFTCSP